MPRPVEAAGAPRAQRSGTAVFALVNDVLKEAGWERGDVEGIALGTGPGSLTGVRAAISIAQGWAFATAVQVFSSASTNVIAWDLFEAGFRGAATIAFDGQRGEIYAAEWLVQDSGVSAATSLSCVAAQDLRRSAASGALLCGPDLERLLPEARVLFPTAAGLARGIARGGVEPQAPQALAPVYLRETQFVKIPAQPR